ncbi:normocyte binding protein 2b [Francisella sp. Scap27]|uniref:normocyte binding protein 2b n=1 Tax=Francisella sp. Scap27 TaxID=2589986 RepID=UPI0015C1269C|nr:normocyte binding protein 2b [Francisella sp. Scap27]QLE78343.1 normocyte binding protein 2b [Francisella sp. Scap27]
MSKKYCVIKESQRMRTLLTIIKAHYESDNKDSLQEVNLEHVLNNVVNEDIKGIIKNAWRDLQITIGFEIRLLENNCKKSLINRLYKKTEDMSFIVTSTNDDFFSRIQDYSSQVELKLINI